MPYLIQGVFFQQEPLLRLGKRLLGETALIFNNRLMYTVYFGVIGKDPDRPLGPLTGAMQDHFGESVLSEIVISETEIAFTKQYVRRSDKIRYTFKQKDGQFWIGEYDGEDTGTGTSRCVITEVPDVFFVPDGITEKLGRKSAHEWSEERHPEADLWESDGKGGLRIKDEDAGEPESPFGSDGRKPF